MPKYSYLLPISVLIIALSVAYYFVIFLPQKEQKELEIQSLKIEQQRRDNKTKSVMLNSCLDDVNERFKNAVSQQKISMSNEAWKIILDLIEKQKNECFKKYPIN